MMDTTAIINSGDLELYVYGLLSDDETKRVASLVKENPEVAKEVASIEKSILQLSSSFAPHISSEVFEQVKAKLALKQSQVMPMKPRTTPFQYLGWAASFTLLFGLGYQYFQTNAVTNKLNTVKTEKENLQKSVVELELTNKQTATALSIIRDTNNTVVNLAGQTVSPASYAKIYWNKATTSVYVDASGLPKPPKGKVYQIWSLKLSPTLTPTSIGLLENFEANPQKIFAVSGTNNAEAFGITLEPTGGSQVPTMEQLYTLGKV